MGSFAKKSTEADATRTSGAHPPLAGRTSGPSEDTRSMNFRTHPFKRGHLAFVAVLAVLLGGVAFACGTDDGNGAGPCEGASCDGGSESSTTDGPGTDTSIGDGGGGGDAHADSSIQVSCGEAGAGTLDPAFGDGGVVVLTYPSSSANSVVVQPDGKIVIGGYTAQSLALVRLMPDGSLDSTFGSTGFVQVPLGDFGAIVSALALQADGKIVGAGSAHIPGSPAGDRGDFAIIRFLANGSLDPTFGDAGIVTTNIGGTDQAYAVAVLADGHVLASGNTGKPSDFAVVRYNADGSLDATFGSGGKVATDVGGFLDHAYGMAVLPDGRIVLGGGSSEDGGAVSNTHFSAARYNADGSPDTSFADAGAFVANDVGTFADIARALVSDQAGKLVLAGGRNGDFTLVRLTAGGSIDGTFGSGGFAATDFGGDDTAMTLRVQVDGKLLASGIRGVGANPSTDLVIARYLAAGSLDPSFGLAGKVITSFGTLFGAVGNAEAVTGCGLIVVGTLSDTTGQSLNPTAMLITRYGL